MPHPTPPVRRRRPQDNLRAASRRVQRGSSAAPQTIVKGAGPPLKPSGPGKQSPGGPPAKGYGKPLAPATAPGRVISRKAQPTTSPNAAPPVLGASAAAPGDVLAQPNAGTNTGAGGAGGPLGGAERVGKRFTVGFTPDGRVVHLYGTDVPAAQRRIVLRKGQTA